jgi:hypothetical protein
VSSHSGPAAYIEPKSLRDPTALDALYAQIEKEIDVDNLVYRKLRIWPLIRQKFGFNYLLSRDVASLRSSPPLSGIEKVVGVPMQLFKIVFHLANFFISIPRIKASNWFMVTEQEIFADRVDGKKYCRYVDPYFEFFAKNGMSSVRITVDSFEASPCTGPEYSHQAIIYHLKPLQKAWFCMQRLRGYFKSKQKDLDDAIKSLDSVRKHIDKEDQHFLADSFYDVFEDVKSFEFCFKVIFLFRRPQNVYMECYYSEMKMGLIAAAAKRGIKTVEIQHGAIYDFMYTPFRTDLSVHTLVPNVLWCWSINDVDRVLSENGYQKKLKPLHLGNLWYNRMRQVAENTIPAQYQNLHKRWTKVVVITLQPMIGYQSIFEKIIGSSPVNWLFVMRYHPLMSDEEKQAYRSALERRENVEFANNGLINLFQSFLISDIHLTHSSTSAVEALSFDLPSFFVNKFGYSYFREMTDKGLFLFSEDHNEIVRLIGETDSLANASSDYKLDIEDSVLLSRIQHNLLDPCAA